MTATTGSEIRVQDTISVRRKNMGLAAVAFMDSAAFALRSFSSVSGLKTSGCIWELKQF
jgi:hypothetical protein